MAKGGGSQLSQLKSKLHAAGVTDRRQQSKKSKLRKGGQDEKDAAAARRNKINNITASLNPFDEKVTKPKHDVLGRKVKGAVGRPGAAKASGLAQRRATLLPEWQARNKSGSFIDRRFGENDANMTPEERMLERFTAEKQRRASKGAMFNLNDGDDEVLTHYGQSLSGLDDLADIGLPDDDEEAGNMDATNHFGGFGEDDDEDPDRQKSKAEVMREVMAKSKFHKLERQKIRDEDEELRMQLDDDLGGIRDLLFAQPAKPEEPSAAQDKEVAKPAPSEKATEKAAEGGDKRPLVEPKVSSNSYDAFVKELAFEKRAKPQDRLKSEAELAAEEAQRLMKAERARLKRMRADSDDEGGSDEEGGRGKRRKKADKSKARLAGADDLDDDFELDGVTAGEAYGLGKGLRTEGSDDEDDESYEEDDEEEEGEADGDEDQDDDDDDFADLADVDALAVAGEDEESEEEGEHEALTGAASASKKSGKAPGGKKLAMTKEEASKLPYTFPCPATHSDFLTVLEEHNIEPKFVPTVVKRIRTLYHPSLHEDNKHKLQAFVGVLLDHAIHSAALAGQNKENKIAVALVNALVPQIFALTQAYPVASSQHFVAKLALMQRNLSRGLAKGAISSEARTWPGVAELTLLRIAGTIWPTSDRQHPVATPLALLIAQYLGHARVRSLTDLTSGLFLCSLVVSHEKDSRRIFPEATNFLFNCIALLAPTDKTGSRKAKKTAENYGIPTPDLDASHAASLTFNAEGKAAATAVEEGPVDLLDLLSPSSDADAATIKAQLLRLALDLTEEFTKLYSGSTAFVEMFAPFSELLASVTVNELPSSVSTRLQTAEASLERQVRLAASSRRYLRLQAHRAIAIASYVPKFDQQGFNPERKGGFDPDTERAQAAKLRALIKKERKGAIRELRKDNQFLAEERRKEQAAEDEVYQKKIKKIMSTLQDERSEQKQMERQKAGLKKRAGKR
ncbi:nucleolar complex protein 14 [Thecaphora frezii]